MEWPRLSNLALLAATATLAACDSACSNDIVRRVAAPGGEHDAVVFQRDCGATTGFSTQVSIVGAGRMPTGGGNVFIADDDHGAAPAAPWGGPDVTLSWTRPDSLLVRYDARARLFLREARVGAVRIEYRAERR
jgi:hypothetical protein